MKSSTMRDSYRIQDPALLATLLREAIRGHGVDTPGAPGLQSFAAADAGLSAPTLSRLLNGKTKRVTLATMSALYGLIPSKDHEKLDRVIVTPQAKMIVSAAREFYEAELGGYVRPRHGRRWVGAADGLRQAPVGRHRGEEARYLVDFVRAQFPDLFERFASSADRFDFPPERLWLAYARVIAPLLDARDSGFMERDWREMEGQAGDWADLRAFVRAGLERERIMLKRPANLQRAQDIAADIGRRPAHFRELSWAKGVNDVHQSRPRSRRTK